MESEERPTKIRKLSQKTEDGAAFLDATIATHDDRRTETEEEPSSNIDANHEDNPKDEMNDDDIKDQERSATIENETPKLSKNQLKKLRRHEKWEAGREDRKVKRKEKIKAKKERRREAWKEQKESLGENDNVAPRLRSSSRFTGEGVQVPITVIFDCDFEDLMFENELKSLGLQITRSYSDNRKARFRAHLAISSFGGKLKERFDGILAKQYTSWQGVRFFSEDFVAVAEKSGDWMKHPTGAADAGALQFFSDKGDVQEEGEVVYLSSESDNTLERLKPNSTYIIGGLVDKNRHKGICYKRAKDRGIKTAKLPIGQYLQMNSRQVLVTNHVLEIMLKWIEYGDWGKAFMEVMPKRKGGVLKDEAGEETTNTQHDGEDRGSQDMSEEDTKSSLDEEEAAPATKDGFIEANILEVAVEASSK